MRCVCCTLAVSSCTSGFMELDLLKKRAEKITSGNIVSGNKLDHELRVVPGLNFNCSGNITSLLLGADVRTCNGPEYPEVGIWRLIKTFIGNYYDRESRQEIRMSEGDFSSNGVLQYNLTTPLSFQNGDVLGVYQPPENDSAVRMYYYDDTSAPVAEFVNNSNSGIVIPAFTPDLTSHHLLILPITGKINSNCNFNNSFKN